MKFKNVKILRLGQGNKRTVLTLAIPNEDNQESLLDIGKNTKQKADIDVILTTQNTPA